MSKEQPELESLFQAALEFTSPEERAAYLARSCGDNESLRAEVDRLLASHQVAGSFLEKPLFDVDATLFQRPAGQDLTVALEAGLAPAFREGEAVVLGHAGHSVFRGPGHDIESPRVALRQSPAEGHDPVVRPSSSEMPEKKSDSRYQLQGEIARGGMGAILKGRDTDLGRDLAIKVLLDAHKDKPEVIQRFIEEAQIGGQLQHPGIAPVYELGQFADRRPFFSMKLVKGETLAKLLAERKEPTEERGKFLGIFEQVCQTMAYAHSRGVIHRDLKPSNIMVGAFGEVQVMDWGLAKVLSAGGVADEKKSQRSQKDTSLVQTLRSQAGSDAPEADGRVGSQTQIGSVLGTPAYMPPEQALGEVDHLDERADAFGLGAILCEILTGKPPYVGEDGTEIFRKACRGKLDDCLARLDACGADAELIALAKQCLELEPSNRPRDAGLLAGRVSGYLESVEAKLRATELARVDAQVRAEELLRRQKLTFVAGSAIAASLLIGFTISAWQAVRATRAEQNAVAAFDELRESAPAFAEQARALAAQERFDEAVAKLDYAIKLRPDLAEYPTAKADLLQCRLRLAEAAVVYREALGVEPGQARAEASAKLCEELLAAPSGSDGKLSRESLAKLHRAMQEQRRPAAELMPVARLLGEEKKLLVDYWLARLKDLPVTAERPLKERLTVREDGRLALDLSGTRVLSLELLADAPLAVLKLSRAGEGGEPIDLGPLKNLKLIELDIITGVDDLSPLSAMHTLEKLNLAGSKVGDLSGIAGLRLKKLNLHGCPVHDLAPIKNMPLEEIGLRDTRVTTLAPLVGMPIKSIELANVPVVDFSPLALLPLERCYCQSVQILDLTVFRGRPLKELVLWNCNEARKFSALTEIKTLELLVIPASFRNMPEEDYAAIGELRNLPRLRQMWGDEGLFGAEAPQVGDGESQFIAAVRTMTPAVDDFRKVWDREQAFVPALRKSGFSFGLDMWSDGRYSLWLREQAITDLSIIRGAPLAELWCVSCPQLADLSPLEGMQLQVLNVCFSKVANLEALRGMPLRRIFLSGTRVTDVAPLADSPLEDVYLDRCPLPSDMTPLAKIATLRNLLVPPQAENVEALRDHPKLERLGYKLTGILPMLPESSATEFWKSYRANPWITALRKAGIESRTTKRLDDGTWELDLSGSTLSDLSVLAGAPISSLKLNKTAITDLTPLRGMPLTAISLVGCATLTDVSPLAEAGTLEQIILPPNAANFELLRKLPKLEYLSFAETRTSPRMPDKTADRFWKEHDAQAWLRKLRDSGVIVPGARQLPDGTWELNLTRSNVRDLSLLRGAPISVLSVNTTAVADLEPLRGMALKELNLSNTPVADLSPLAGMPLELLALRNTRVTDLSILRGMKLKSLLLAHTKVPTELAPLADCPALVNLTLPPNAKDIEFLREHPTLERISFEENPQNTFHPEQSAAEFWKAYDAKKK